MKAKISKTPDNPGITRSKNMWAESVSIAQYRKLVKKKPKYGNKTAVKDGHGFDSQKESRRYQDLKLLEKAGEIQNLDLQTPFEIVINGVRVCIYRSDFTYFENGKLVVEDVKSEATRKLPLYRLKKKLVKAWLNLEIQEV